MSRYRHLFILLALSLLLAVVAQAQAAPTLQENLLQNPGFEGAYSSYYPRTGQEHADCPHGICTTVQVPPGWNPWWVKTRDSDVNPEYKPAAGYPRRIHSGGNAAQYFSFHRTHTAGLYQQATVPAGASVQFTIWGQAWVSAQDTGGSDSAAWVNMRIGIDPAGGTNPFSPQVVWSDTKHPFDQYQQFSVQAQAQGTQVTVFTYSAPSFSMKHNDVYWDDAALVVMGQSAPPPAPPPAPAPAPAPSPGGSPSGTYTVQPGDNLYRIASRFGVAMPALAAFNNISNPSLIRVGQVLNIPGGAAAPPTEDVPPPADGSVQATTQVNLRLRFGPSTEYEILTVVPRGTTVPVLGRTSDSNWIQVRYGQQTGWMAAWHTTVSAGLASLPVTAP